MAFYKLTNQNMQTYNGFQWKLGEWHFIPEEDQQDDLCSSGFFHCYNHPALAIIFNSIHARFDNPRLFEIEVDGNSKNDNNVKFGFTKMKLIKEIKLPIITLEQRVEFAIRCAMEVYNEKEWLNWAENWLSGKDRTAAAAYIYANVVNAFTADTFAANAAYANAAFASNTVFAVTNVACAARAAKIDFIKIIEKVLG